METKSGGEEMKKKLINTCPFCKHKTKVNVRGAVFNSLKDAIYWFLIFMGFLFVIILALTGKQRIIDAIVQPDYRELNEPFAEELRNITTDYTAYCWGDNSTCYAIELFKRVAPIRYLPASYYEPLDNPIWVWQHGGDCKNTANMYTAMLNSVGIQAKMSCNLEYRHCMTVVNEIYRGWDQGSYLVVDLTVPAIWRLYDYQDPWLYWLMDQNQSIFTY